MSRRAPTSLRATITQTSALTSIGHGPLARPLITRPSARTTYATTPCNESYVPNRQVSHMHRPIVPRAHLHSSPNPQLYAITLHAAPRTLGNAKCNTQEEFRNHNAPETRLNCSMRCPSFCLVCTLNVFAVPGKLISRSHHIGRHPEVPTQPSSGDTRAKFGRQPTRIQTPWAQRAKC